MAKATRAIDSIKKQLQTETLNILLQTLVFFHVDYSSLFRQHMTNASLLFLEKQMNWALKRVFFSFEFQVVYRIQTEQKYNQCQKFFETQVIMLFASVHQKRNTANYRLNLRSNVFVLQMKTSSVLFSKYFLHDFCKLKLTAVTYS